MNFEIVDLTEKYKHLFTLQSLSVLETKKNLNPFILIENNELLGLTYLAGSVSVENEYKFTKELVNAFNDLCSKGMVRGVLSPLSKIELAPTDMEKREAIFLFAHIDDPKKYVSETYPDLVTMEGGIGIYHGY